MLAIIMHILTVILVIMFHIIISFLSSLLYIFLNLRAGATNLNEFDRNQSQPTLLCPALRFHGDQFLLLKYSQSLGRFGQLPLPQASF